MWHPGKVYSKPEDRFVNKEVVLLSVKNKSKFAVVCFTYALFILKINILSCTFCHLKEAVY